MIELFGKTIEANKQVAGKAICLALGKTGTGAGKSTIHFLAGSTMAKKQMNIALLNHVIKNIGTLCGSPPFDDTSGAEVDIGTGLRIVQSVSKTRSVKILVRYVSTWCCITTIKCNIKSYGW